MPIELVLEGSETELDNNIIQQISRSAHLTSFAMRWPMGLRTCSRGGCQLGKPETGRITVRAYHQRKSGYSSKWKTMAGGSTTKKSVLGIVESGALSEMGAAALSQSASFREYLFRPEFFNPPPPRRELRWPRRVGLDVVRLNVHSLNGEIDVRSELSRGACFTVKVPLYAHHFRRLFSFAAARP